MVLGSVVNGKVQPPSWGSPVEQPNQFKMNFNDISLGIKGITASEAVGVKVGIIVDASSSLMDITMDPSVQLYYSIFSADVKACPRNFAYPPPPSN